MKIYRNPTARVVANGALKQLPGYLKSKNIRKPLIVLGGNFFKLSAYCHELRAMLAPLEYEEALPVEANPTVSFVADFCAQYRCRDFDAVIGIGGGSAMDAAKMAAVLLTQSEEALKRQIESRDGFKNTPLLMVAVPTTSGTGSEVTPYVSLETEARKKITVTHDFLFPALALIDPVLTYSMPPSVTASTGFDALSQSIEAFWSVHHSPFSDAHALRAVELIIQNLSTAVFEPSNIRARYDMSWAACESGLAIAYTATTAVHSVSYPLTTFYGIAHGHACALTLAEFLRFNETVMEEPRYQDLWRAMGVENAQGAALAVERLMEEVGLERSLKNLGIKKENLEEIVQNAFRPDRVKNNPRALTADTVREMLSRIYEVVPAAASNETRRSIL